MQMKSFITTGYLERPSDNDSVEDDFEKFLSDLYHSYCFLQAVLFRQCSTLPFRQQDTQEMCQNYHKNLERLFFSFIYLAFVYALWVVTLGLVCQYNVRGAL